MTRYSPLQWGFGVGLGLLFAQAFAVLLAGIVFLIFPGLLAAIARGAM